MTTNETQKEAQDQAGTLAESARRHIAYERLARQVAAGEAAAQMVLDALARKQKATGGADTEAAKARQITLRNDDDAKNNFGG